MSEATGASFNTISSITKRLIKAGDIEGKNKSWTEEDDKFIIENYKNIHITVIADYLDVTPAKVSDRYFKLKSNKLKSRKQVKKEIEATKRELEQRQVNEINKRLANEEEAHISQGLQFKKLKLVKGNKYKIDYDYRGETRSCKGKLIQDCSTHLVFKTNIGYCESFLKSDLLTTYKYKEIPSLT